MAFEIPFVEPECFSAGDRVQWFRTLADFPISEGWVLTYYLRGNFAHAPLDITATTSGTDYSVDLTPEETAEYTPGVYYWQAFVSVSGDRKLIGSGKFTVLRNPSDITEPFDGRTHARRCLDSIEALLENKATRDEVRYVIQATGLSVDKLTPKQLTEFRDYYLVEVRREEGNGRRRQIVIVFK